MKITKKLESEILHVMDEYWGSYLNGDLPTWASYLPDDYKNIGTTKAEIWNSKKEIVEFTEKVLDQTVGMAETRNKKVQIIPYGPYFMVHELGDLYVKAEEGWVFYAPFRLSSLLEKTADGWKILHQHGSYPDAKADEGEAFAFNELKVENKKLRDAIQARTIELERKNRELEIEAALERVRARALAMHRSDELGATSLLLFDELKALGEISEQISIGIFDEEKQVLNLYATLQGEQWKEASKIDLDEPVVMQKIYAGWQQKKKSIQIDLSGEELKAYNSFRSKYSNLKFPEERWVIHCAFFSKGVLTFSTTTPHDEQTMQLLERFAQVFDGTYTRFLDLQKAEAQAREAQIEAALERVRAQTMAMHSSEDVGECIVTMFSEVTALGVPESTRFGIGILNHDNENNQLWTASKDGKEVKMHIGNIEMTWHPLLISARKAWKAQVPLHEYVLEGEDLQKYYQMLNDAPDYPLRVAMENLPERQFHYGFVFEHGFFYAFSPCEFQPDLIRIVYRFTSLFGQTYRRYLDLKKAEAQAREAQIEAALESVRARAMAMHQSSELRDVVSVMYDKMETLGLAKWGCSIMICHEETTEFEFWMAEETDSNLTGNYFAKGKEHPVYRKLWMHWKKQGPPITLHHKDAVKREFDEYWFNKTDFRHLPEVVKASVFDRNEVFLNYATMRHGLLSAYSYERPSDKLMDVLARFAKVFEQTYTRFLDIQKAEAQAREAQIEAALERIRSQATSMQQSTDLLDVVVIMRNEFNRLGHEAHYFWHMLWTPDKYEKAMTSGDGTRIGFVMELPRYIHGNIPLLAEWEKSDTSTVVYPMDVEAAIDYVHKMIALGDFKNIDPNAPGDDDIRHIGGLTFIMARTTHGEIGYSLPGMVPNPPAEDLDILVRFAGAFDLAHQRFLDLQKAEKQAQEIREERDRLEKTLHDLQLTQQQLIQSEKLASLGELTAGIAHEIQNPLNFVNNFAEMSVELAEELKEEIGKLEIEAEDKAFIDELMDDLTSNQQKINHHGKRASSIVSGMLQHSRTSTGTKEPTDLNALADEYLRLAYHGLRAKDSSFNAKMETDFDPNIGKVDVIPQDIGRVFLNIISNAFYATQQRRKEIGKLEIGNSEEQYEPTVSISSRVVPPLGGQGAGQVVFNIKDNGPGIPDEVKAKIFQPFFTTKPTGQGTGLGLSISYDIIVKGHGGSMTVESEEGKGTEFIITLPA